MVQHGAARFVTGKPWKRDQRDSILRSLDWSTLQKRRKQASLVLLYKILNDLLPIPVPIFRKDHLYWGPTLHTVLNLYPVSLVLTYISAPSCLELYLNGID